MAALGDYTGRWFAGNKGWKEATAEAPLALGFAFELDQTAYELPPERRRPRSFIHAYIFKDREAVLLGPREVGGGLEEAAEVIEICTVQEEGDSMDRSTNIDRRGFVAGSAALTGGLLLGAPAILSAQAKGEKLGIAVIGCGGQGGGNPGLAAGERLVALVDVDDKKHRRGRQDASPPRCTDPKIYHDYRKMFDECHKEIDAVLIATPDHHHAPAAIRAIQLGKHVFVREADDLVPVRGPQADRGGPQAQGRHADGQPGPQRRGLPPAVRVHLGRGHRQRHRDAQPDERSFGGTRRPAQGQAGPGGPALGRVARAGRSRATTTTACTRSAGASGATSAPARSATWAATSSTASSGR